MAQSVMPKRDISQVAVEPDNDLPVKMGDPTVDVTEENKEGARILKSRAMELVVNGELDEAINHLTEAVVLNPKSAMLFASRATVFVKLKKPNAAIRDADAALQIDPDLAKGYIARGMARSLLGLWEEAARDFDMVLQLDFDEETCMMLNKGYASMLRDGQVIEVETVEDLVTKLNAASKLSRLTVVYFTATWCGPCRYISPPCTELAAKNGKVVFLKVDVDKLVELVWEWGINSIPSFCLWKGGKVFDKVVDCDMSSLENKMAELAVYFETCDLRPCGIKTLTLSIRVR